MNKNEIRFQEGDKVTLRFVYADDARSGLKSGMVGAVVIKDRVPLVEFEGVHGKHRVHQIQLDFLDIEAHNRAKLLDQVKILNKD